MHVLWHLLVIGYFVGILVTWAVTYVVDGYREARDRYHHRDPEYRFLTCMFWPLVMVFHRLVNIAEFVGWGFDKTVSGLRALGAAFVRKKG